MVSAQLRTNFIEEILGIKESEDITITKGCTSNFLDLCEEYIVAFENKLQEIEPFVNEGRKLKQPYTNIEPSEKIKKDMLESKKIGREVVEGYVKTRFCDRLHNIHQENLPMKKIKLSLFKKPQKKKKQGNKEKTQVEVSINPHIDNFQIHRTY